MDGWKTTILLGFGLFSGAKMLVSEEGIFLLYPLAVSVVATKVSNPTSAKHWISGILKCFTFTLPETNILAPENRPKPNRKQSYSNHPFLGAFAVSFREGTTTVTTKENFQLMSPGIRRYRLLLRL